ncbi:hypothetical protein HBHAL_2814 [Halobacillus halophilus DSM 2266]|uniref:Uncharacterized protein n=1 Tax=Halobacillus halophilus (strain ATCC 35676 / DSM 2266 / JCM 20832 / KCTC 3685 / LMG 17431 / NBRC 102448 / NCIMB 2269) TaxID=866895 RepID=I0JLZ2_HALH3|nr:hypothetical protein HBHAL_2814 [Halobacillus halophilus DSM 2266]
MIFSHQPSDVLNNFEHLILPGPEGDDVDSCGMNMIGEIPQAAKPEEAHLMPAESEIVPRRTFRSTNISKSSLTQTGAYL